MKEVQFHNLLFCNIHVCLCQVETWMHKSILGQASDFYLYFQFLTSKFLIFAPDAFLKYKKYTVVDRKFEIH